MKKVININFQGRVIPIEEAAYDNLKQYVESLRAFFANEEGKDEIINDIEGRIAELFGELLKKGSTCITNDDVDNIIAGMGRPADFEEEENNTRYQTGTETKQAGTSTGTTGAESGGRGRLYRDVNDKILGGVCSGLAAYFRIDPTIVRLIFVLFTFSGGAGILLYILFWVILPSRSLEQIPSGKRLFRNTEEKVVAGVASGIATYFDIAIWIPRLVFAMPLVLGIFASILRSVFWFQMDTGDIIFSSFGGTLFIIYIVLWAVIPEAKTASEKLEMRGEKVDLNSIKNTIQEDLEGFKTRAEKWGGEFSEKAKVFGSEFGNTVNQKSKQFSSEAAYAGKSGGNRLLNGIGIVFKAFFLFIAGIIAFALLVALMAIMFAGIGAFPLKNLFLDGFWQNFLAWSTMILFLLVPIIGIVTWIIRRVLGMRSGNKYLGYTFGGLWTMGWISIVFLAALISKDFDARATDRNEVTIAQPTNGKLLFQLNDSNTKVRRASKWINLDGFITAEKDSFVLSNINVRFTRSNDSLFHVIYTKQSNGKDEETALKNMDEIQYRLTQTDSIISLNNGFRLKKGTRFRNQGLIVTVQVPLGGKVETDRSIRRNFHWVNINNNDDDHGLIFRVDEEDDRNGTNYRNLSSNTAYIMTRDGLEREEKLEKSEIESGSTDEEELSGTKEYKKSAKSREELQKEYDRKRKEAEELKKELDKPADTTRYRYQKVTAVEPGSVQPKSNNKTKAPAETIDLGTEAGRLSLLLLQS